MIRWGWLCVWVGFGLICGHPLSVRAQQDEPAQSEEAMQIASDAAEQSVPEDQAPNVADDRGQRRGPDTQPPTADRGTTVRGVSITSEAEPEPAEPQVEEAAQDFELDIIGFLRSGYKYVFPDANYDFIGRNSGFVLVNARIGADLDHRETGLGFRVSVEGAVDVENAINTPQSALDVRIRDAYARWRWDDLMGGAFELRVGQSRAPFTGEEWVSVSELLFAQRAIGESGVQVGDGFELPGLDPRRQLGVWAGLSEPIELGPMRLGASFMIANGAGENQLLNDNDQYAYYGRLTLGFEEYATLALAGYHNARTEGMLPDLFEETDVGFATDLRVRYEGAEFYGQMMLVQTDYPTVDAPSRLQLAYHLQGAYEVEIGQWRVAPGYRFASFQPWLEGAGPMTDLGEYLVQQHTFGVRTSYLADFGRLSLYLQYTLCIEDSARVVDNDRIEALVQLTY